MRKMSDGVAGLPELRVVENKENECLEVFLNGILVGRVRGNTYITRRRYEHYFRKFNGFGISTEVLRWLNRHDISKILIIYVNEDGSEALLRSDLSQWLSSSIEWIDYSNGFEDPQQVLSVLEMEVEGYPEFWGKEG